MTILYKYCKYELCKKRFDREEGLTNANWKLKAYCCHDHQIKSGNLVRSRERANWKYCSYCKKKHQETSPFGIQQRQSKV